MEQTMAFADAAAANDSNFAKLAHDADAQASLGASAAATWGRPASLLDAAAVTTVENDCLG